MARRLLSILALLLLGLSAALFARDEFSLGNGLVEVQGFHTNGENLLKLSEAGTERVQWRVSGARARLVERVFSLYGFQMTLEGEQAGKYVIESPLCLFDQQKGEVRSAAAVQVAGPFGPDGPRCRMSGIGYDVLWRGAGESLVLVIRNAVWLEFDQGLFNEIDEKRVQYNNKE